SIRKYFNIYIHKLIKNRIEMILKNDFSNIQLINNNEESNSRREKIVWVSWLQGEEHAPEIVKDCIRSIRKFIPNDYRFILIDESNFNKYINFPKHIDDKIKSGKITKTHLSDLMRWYLIYNFGGIWIDATIHMSKKLENDMLDNFLTFKTEKDPELKYIANGRWTGFMIGGEVHYQPAAQILNTLYKYWLVEDKMLDYFLIDYVLDYTYEKNEQFRFDIDTKSFLNNFIYKRINEEISLEENHYGINKLSYK
ncbi:capsular polysaccharide synthesis protein, partial [Rosenbergiella epipactidis]|uniref:capsular polysaccharide synthesis protein n=1 Tax=Rosenbergiella epipactidis TaxID=1544694 RepID=UPI001F4ED888